MDVVLIHLTYSSGTYTIKLASGRIVGFMEKLKLDDSKFELYSCSLYQYFEL